MRPIDKGKCPQINGRDKVVTKYQDWRADLVDRLGSYCCYCNIPLSESPQVEHVIPKNPKQGNPVGAVLDWENLLLACGACNRAKHNKPVSNNEHYLPENNNTYLAFGYSEVSAINGKKACIIVPGQDIRINKSKSANTVKLLALDSTKSSPRITDMRWKFRYDALVSAQIWKAEWDKWGKYQSNEFLRLLSDTVRTKGFFSIWYSVFEDEQEVKSLLLQVFPGTDKKSFEQLPPYNPLPRNPSRLTDPI